MRVGHAAVALLLILAMQHAEIASAACNIVDGKAYGDCGNVRINTASKKALKVRGQAAESAIIEGATVFPGGSLSLSGISNGDIIVNKGGTLYVSGVVNGTVKNLGGAVEIEGSVQEVQTNGGRVVIGGTVGTVNGSGPVTYKKGAVVGGVPTTKTTRTKTKQ
jgi:hypothetical protein